MTISEETYMFAERHAHFLNVFTIYRDLLSGHYKPSVNISENPREASSDEFDPTSVRCTAMYLLYAYFYSMVEDDPQGVNGFRVWRATWPEEEEAIVAVESLVKPLIPGLKLFRNRMGFHGSRSRAHEGKGLDFFTQHSGAAVWNAIVKFKALAAALFQKDLARQYGTDPSPARQKLDRIAAGCAAATTPLADL